MTKEEYSAASNLVTSRLRDAVGLTLVLGNVVVHQRDDVRPANIQNDILKVCNKQVINSTAAEEAHLTGALKTAGRQTVVPVGAFLSLWTPISGRAAARDILASENRINRISSQLLG